MRSVTEWAQLVRTPLAQLRAEIWRALIDAKDGTGSDDEMSWPELIQRWRKGEDDKTILARWRRGLDPKDPRNTAIEITTLGEALEALYLVRDRLSPGATPHVRRLLYDEPDPADRMLKVFYPKSEGEQDVSGLSGTWRLVHHQSDGMGFISWRVVITPAIEPNGGPGAWFNMETSISAAHSPRNPRDAPRIAHSVKGAVHGVGAMFYLVGADHEHQVVTASFASPHGQLPANSFDRAQGLIQRIGTLGLYAARAVFSRVESVSDDEIGRHTLENIDSGLLDGLADDITILASAAGQTGTPACLVSAHQVHGL